MFSDSTCIISSRLGAPKAFRTPISEIRLRMRDKVSPDKLPAGTIYKTSNVSMYCRTASFTEGRLLAE